VITVTEITLFGPITQLLTMSGLPERGSILDDQLFVLADAGMVVADGLVIEVGRYHYMRQKYSSAKLQVLPHESVVLPGFIDCHTHLCWSGSRSRDFAMRNAGHSYLEIAESGGGIWDTVTKTRNATDEELISNTLNRTRMVPTWGVTTVEVKSGYGVSVEQELRMLRVIKIVSSQSSVDIIPTCLAAHIVPRDYTGDALMYLQEITNELLPVIKAENLSNRIDIFVEKTAFDVGQASEYLSMAKALGFDVLIHADQFTTGGSVLGARFGAVSVDHLEASTAYEIEQIVKSDCVAVALPGASIGLGEPFTPARRILDRGGILAIASDWNPGSAPMGNLLIQASVLATHEKLSTAEVFSGLTTRAARALRLFDRGKLESGMKADFQCYKTNDYREILYHQGLMSPETVWKEGVKVYGKTTG
jgi:imidazolonepropionase